MRCPICKTELAPGEPKEYETLMEHVSDPNKKSYPLRSTYLCPNKCFEEEQFFDTNGSSYSRSFRMHEKYYSALDSFDRKVAIGAYMSSLGCGFWRYRRKILNLKIEGENDIPPFLTMVATWVKCRYLRSWFTHKRREELYRRMKLA